MNYPTVPGCCVDNFDGDVLRVGPTKSSVPGGFTIRATYCFGECLPFDGQNAFSYKYVESYTFLETGEWTAKLDIYGPGLTTTHDYEVFWRIDYDVNLSTNNVFERWNNGGWVIIGTEAEFIDDGLNAAGGYEWRQSRAQAQRYRVNPLSFPDAYKDLVVVYHAGENGGAGIDKDFPAQLYDNNEATNVADLVQWHHGLRDYTRPAGCVSGGGGCGQAFGVSFTATPVGY